MRVSSDEGGCGFVRVVGMADVWGWWEVGMAGRWGWRWIYRKTGGVAEMKDNDAKGGRRVVLVAAGTAGGVYAKGRV